MRIFSITTNSNIYASGSCNAYAGNTQVHCAASFSNKVPIFLQKEKKGWISAEYAMLPHATYTRSDRESSSKPRGRSMEIQRLIGRCLRSVCDLTVLEGFQIRLDCDVIQADGGTRVTAINGGFVALAITFAKMMQSGLITKTPLLNKLCALSCVIKDGKPIFDPSYQEDSSADADINLVFTHTGHLVEIQGTGEQGPIQIQSWSDFITESFEKTSEIRKSQNQALAQMGL